MADGSDRLRELQRAKPIVLGLGSWPLSQVGSEVSRQPSDLVQQFVLIPGRCEMTTAQLAPQRRDEHAFPFAQARYNSVLVHRLPIRSRH